MLGGISAVKHGDDRTAASRVEKGKPALPPAAAASDAKAAAARGPTKSAQKKSKRAKDDGGDDEERPKQPKQLTPRAVEKEGYNMQAKMCLEMYRRGIAAYWRRSTYIRESDHEAVDGFADQEPDGRGPLCSNNGKETGTWAGLPEGLTGRTISMFHHVCATLPRWEHYSHGRLLYQNVGWISTAEWRYYIDERRLTWKKLLDARGGVAKSEKAIQEQIKAHKRAGRISKRFAEKTQSHLHLGALNAFGTSDVNRKLDPEEEKALGPIVKGYRAPPAPAAK